MTYDLFLGIFMLIFMGVYLWLFYTAILKRDMQRQQVRRFYNAIVSVFKEALPIEVAFAQLKLNYEKLIQTTSGGNYNSILDILEVIVYYYDTYPDKLFKSIFRTDKAPEIRHFVIEMCNYIKKINPFISSPLKEAALMRTIRNALDSNNVPLGENSLMQLSIEIESKEKLL